MKITIEHYDEKVSIETERDDLSFNEFMEQTKRIAFAIYNPETVKNWWNVS
jgi:hypothetical protein